MIPNPFPCLLLGNVRRHIADIGNNHWEGYYLWAGFSHLYRVLWPRPQEVLQEAQLDQELQLQLA